MASTSYFSVTSPSSMDNVGDDIARDLARDVAHRTVQETVTAADVTTAIEASDALDALSNETVQVAVDGTAGTFTLIFGADETAALDFDATPAEVEAALAALDTLNAGDVEVLGGPGDDGGTTPYYLQFVGSKRGTNVGAVTANDSLTGGAGTVTITVVIAGGATPSA